MVLCLKKRYNKKKNLIKKYKIKNMEPDIKNQFEIQEKKLNDIYRSVEKMRKYFLWSLIITVSTIVLPSIALAFVIPWFLHIMTSTYSI